MRSPDLLHWGNQTPLSIFGGDWQTGRVGAGAPPLRISDGWLEIYHGNRQPTLPGEVGTYYGGALLLDPDDPTRVLRGTPEPFFVPEADFELRGFLTSIVFPTGVVRDGDGLLIYYGAADADTGVVELSERDVLGTLISVGGRGFAWETPGS